MELFLLYVGAFVVAFFVGYGVTVFIIDVLFK